MANTNHFGKVAVLLGGTSGERDVSLKSGNAVLAALLRQGVDAHAFDPATQELSALKGFDHVMINLHGRGGEDGTIQGALELMGIPYTGSGVMASSLGMDKWRSKLLWKALNIATPEFEMVNAQSDFKTIENKLGLPLFVKPANEGSSIGITKVKNKGELEAAYLLAAKADPLVILRNLWVVANTQWGLFQTEKATLPHYQLYALYQKTSFTIMKRNTCVTTPNTCAHAV